MMSLAAPFASQQERTLILQSSDSAFDRNIWRRYISPHAPMTSSLEGGLGGFLTISTTSSITSKSNSPLNDPDGSTSCIRPNIDASKSESQDGSRRTSMQFLNFLGAEPGNFSIFSCNDTFCWKYYFAFFI